MTEAPIGVICVCPEKTGIAPDDSSTPPEVKFQNESCTVDSQMFPDASYVTELGL